MLGLKSSLFKQPRIEIMFEVSGNDILNLGDSDLRSLITRLAIAELIRKGYPRSSITAGGNQDAADGGLDVRIECPAEISDPDFVPKRITGFQIKKPDMPPSEILNEMRPKGILRDVIRELANKSGAYVIVSSQGSVADKPLASRRQAMRAALKGMRNAAQLHTDFYDRERLANWANEYPGVIAWVRSRVGRPLSGWSGIGDWEGSNGHDPRLYLSNDKACFIDERSRKREHLTIKDGIARLRIALSTPKQCIRLVGLSGTGKTRLVQALFEEGLGENPLDSGLAIYTDYSEETDPTARDMARALIAQSQRAILIVDNCNPATHAELAQLCTSAVSKISLITIEYDVRDDEPEHTGVFRLQSASPELVTEWIKQRFPDISEVDRNKIGEFSDGNFRVASALAETLAKKETLGHLKSRQLFERLFLQRNEADHQLLRAAEDLSLLYSIDGENVLSESELAHVGSIRGIGAQPLYEAIAEMRKRGVVQARGRFRAILPQAIANPLAIQALDRIPSDHFDQFCGMLTPRMRKSVSRRIGFLHDSPVAQALVVRWLRPDGPLGDLLEMGEPGFQIISNIAPVAPSLILAKLENEFHEPNKAEILKKERHRWIRLIKAIGYSADLFESSVMQLARFLPKQQGEQSFNAFGEFFQLRLSGTQATPEQRRAVIRRLATSTDDDLRRSVHIAIRSLLQSRHFDSMGSNDFGARSRDWGWEPKIYGDIWDWYKEAITLVVEIMPEADARTLLASNVRGLWQIPGCLDAIDRAATAFIQTKPWIEGWIACRATLRYAGEEVSEDLRSKLQEFIKRLSPRDILNQARAVILNRTLGSLDFADGEEDEGDAGEAWSKADKMAQDIGRKLANDATARANFIPEMMVESQAPRAFECGRGLAEGANDIDVMWLELVAAYNVAEPKARNATVLSGFIFEACRLDKKSSSNMLETAIKNAHLLPILPYLHARIGLNSEGIARLRKAIAKGGLVASNFYSIANNSVSNSPPRPLEALLKDIAALSGGVEIAIEILHMHILCREHKGAIIQHSRLVLLGRDLLTRVGFKKNSPLCDYGMHKVINVCLTGEDGINPAKEICSNLRSAFDSYQISPHDLNYVVNALFETQPFVSLDTFLAPVATHLIRRLFDEDFGRGAPLEKIDPTILHEWANRDPNTRYPVLGQCLSIFAKNGDEEKDLSPLFLSMMDQAPDKRLFIGHLLDRLQPRSWGGSLADILIRRKTIIMKLAKHPNDEVRASIANVMPNLDLWIERERERERAGEESFE